METEKRVLVAIVLSIAVLFIYQSYFAPPPRKKVVAPGPQQYQQQQEETIPRATPAPLRKEELKQESFIQETREPAEGEEKLIPVTNGLFSALFSSYGARLSSVKLHNYKDKIPPPAFSQFIKKILGKKGLAQEQYQEYKELIHLKPNQELPLRTAFVGAEGIRSYSNPWHHDTDELTLGTQNKNGTLTFTQTDDTGLTVQKEFFFSADDYKIRFNLTLTNTSDRIQEGNPLIEWSAFCPAKNGGGLFSAGTFTSPQFSYFIKDQVEKKDLAKIEENITIEGDIRWAAIEEKYFISALILEQQKPHQIRVGKTGKQNVAYQLLYPLVSLKPGDKKVYSFALYLGPKDIDILKNQSASLEKIIDFGMFDIFAKPLLLSLKFFYRFLGNYGLAIIVLTIIIKILFWPLTHKSFKSMKGMQQIQPEVAQLKEKYKNDREEFARQQMALYKKYKVNPLGGCLPMLLQIPVFIALYRALMDSIELRHANFISFWINDLSAKDPTYIAPLIMGASMFLQQKMTPTTADPAQAKMMMFMPIIFTVMFLNFPSGLVLYWLVNNVLSIAQQIYTNKKSHDLGGITECSPSKPKQKPSKKRSK